MRPIDADTFKEDMARKYGYHARQPQDDIDAQPTVDAVPVVRCKDCRYAEDYYHDGSIYCCIPGKPMRWHDDDPEWYCADGERKEGEHDEQG